MEEDVKIAENHKFLKSRTINLLVLLCMVLVVAGFNTVSAADVIYVNGTSGSDANDGTSWATAKLSIGNATGTVNSNGLVNVADGTYTGSDNRNITIDSDMTIIGQSQTGTIINAQGLSRIFTVNNGINLNIQNLTLNNGNATGSGNATHGGAIYNNGGTVSVVDSTFTGNTAAQGGAIYNNGGALTVTGSTFTGNTIASGFGGAILIWSGTLNVTDSNFTNNTVVSGEGGAINIQGGTVTVTGSTFTGNTASATGGAIVDYGTLTLTDSTFTNNTAVQGGAILSPGTLTVNNSTFTGNNGGIGGAITSVGSLNVTGSTFMGNTATIQGGAIYKIGTNSEVHFNRILGNTAPGGYDIYVASGSVNATNNWWGSNADPSSRVFGSVTVDPWLVLTITADPTSVMVGGESTITADLLHNSNGESVSGHVPNGIPITFTASNGTINPVSSALINSQATSIFTANTLDIANITATVDNQTVSTNINVLQASTTTVVDDVTGYPGQIVDLVAHVTDSNGNPVTEGQLRFIVNGVILGPVDVVNGLATYNGWLIPADWNVGAYQILAEYLGTDNFAPSNGTGTLTVDPSAGLYLNITTSNANPNVGDTFVITYGIGNYGPNSAENVTVTFQIPEGLEFISISVNNGSWTYDPATRTVTWNLDTVPVGDPQSYLYLTLRALNSGTYVITPTITSDTYNWNSGEVFSITINVQDPRPGPGPEPQPSNGNGSESTVKGETVPMQKTGLPLNYLLLAVLMVISAILVSKRKF